MVKSSNLWLNHTFTTNLQVTCSSGLGTFSSFCVLWSITFLNASKPEHITIYKLPAVVALEHSAPSVSCGLSHFSMHQNLNMIRYNKIIMNSLDNG